MASEPADVLIVGAGASGGVVALRLAEAGFKVVCLEQGDWLDRADYPGNKLDWELQARKQWATSPNIRGLAADYPIVEDDTPVSPLMYNAVGGSTIIFAGAWPRALPSDFRVRSLDGVADDWPIDYFELLPYFYRTDREFGVSGLPGRPGLPAGHRGRADAAAADRRGRAQGRARPHEARLALVAGVQLDQLDAVRRPPAVRPAEHLPVGLQRGRQGLDRPDPLAQGDRPRRAARDRRPRPPHRDRREGPRDRRDLDRRATAPSTSRPAQGRRRSRPTRSARRGCCCSRASPTASGRPGNSSGLVGKRLMMHPFANVAGLFEEPLMSWQGQFGDLIESLEFYETDEKRGFVRGARWGLAPTGGPINTALPSRAGEQIWGPDHHAHVKTHLGHGANWGLFAEDLPDEANHVTLSSTVTDSSGIPAPEVHYTMADNARRMLDFHIERAKESMEAAGRLQDRGRPAHALLGLAPARHGPDGRRPGDVGARPLEPRA